MWLMLIPDPIQHIHKRYGTNTEKTYEKKKMI